MNEYLKEIKIDESRDMALRHSTKNKNNLYTKSEHNVMIGTFNLSFASREAAIRREYFNFKVDDDRVKFIEETSKTTHLSSCFDPQLGFENSCSSFLKKLDKTFHKCFTKVRVKQGGSRRIGDKVIQSIMQAQGQVKQV